MNNSNVAFFRTGLFALVAAAALGSCRGSGSADDPINLLAGNDFETMEGWVGDYAFPALTEEKAHSGRFSVRVGPGVDYSNGYSNQLIKLSPIKMDKVRIRGWVFLPRESVPAVLVTQVTDLGVEKPLLWQGLELAKATSARNKWVPIETVVTLPADSKRTSKLSVFLWSAGSSSPVYLDDLQVLRAR